MAALKYGIICW